ncbi:MAG: FKBP-type peptidyl-prolyl cis-trans isomerase [Planctomycetota bacterium]|jgi:hypothetical protein
MTNMRTTVVLIIIALVLGILAIFAVPSSVEPEAFSDQGEEFFPDFLDPLACKEIEIYEPDAETATISLFNVKFEDGLWQIPSHHGYPADAMDRMATAATAFIGLKKDMIRSDRIEDRAKFGVEDPLDDAASLEGRGKRIVMKDGSGRVMADIIVGNEVEDKRDPADLYKQPRELAYMREPDGKRIYAVNLSPSAESGGDTIKDISTEFNDWIDTDLLHVRSHEIEQLVLYNYTVNEETASVDHEDAITLTKGEEEKWSMNDLTEEEQVSESKVRDLLRNLDTLAVEGVRPQPETMSRMSLASKGFFVGKEGQLYGNEGHMDVFTKEGVLYHLFFGEVLFGTGKEITAGAEDAPEGKEGKDNAVATENRYLFVRVSLNPEWEKEAAEAATAAEEEAKAKAEAEAEAQPEEDEDAEAETKEPEKTELQKKNEEWQKKIEEAQKKVEEANLRFKDWYYVITGDSFEKVRVDRGALIEMKVPDTSSIGEQPEEGREPIKRPSNLHYVDIKRGDGRRPARDGDTLKVLYTGWLKDGTEFDSNLDSENAFTFTLGEGQVITGWDEGLRGVPAGSKRKLIIPPDLGYGEAGSGAKVPPNSWLIFDVEVLEVIEKTE